MDTESSTSSLAETSLQEREFSEFPETLVRRVTQRDVAAAAGLHSTTVSLALRGSSRVSPSTMERVRRIAFSMGFVPDPLIGAFVAHRQRVSGRSGNGTAAFVSCGANAAAASACLEGVRASAGSLGFRVDHLVARTNKRDQRRLNHILYHRGICGIILHGADGSACEWRDLEWDRWSVVAVGTPAVGLPFHRVEFNPIRGLRLASLRAREMGYQRIGVVTPGTRDGLAMGLRASYMHRVIHDDIAEDLVLPVAGSAGQVTREGLEVGADKLARWMRAYRPDVVFGVARQLQPYLDFLGIRVPDDIALVDLDRDESDPFFAGIVQNYRAIGSAAFGVLHQQLRQNQRGFPSVATRTLVDGMWCPGASLRSRTHLP